MEDRSKSYLFEKMPVGQALRSLAVPTIVSQIISLIYSVVDGIFIGQTGDAYKTAAVSLCLTVFLMTISFSNLFGVGGGSLMARLMGQGRGDRAKCVSALSFYGGIGIALLYSLLVGIFMDPLLHFLGASENTVGYARQYLMVVVVAGNLPVILSGIMSHLMRNMGYSRQAAMGLSIGGVLNILLDPLFMFVLLPKGMEVLGAALATLISNCIGFLYLLVIMFKISRTSPLCMDPRELKNLTLGEVKPFFSVGVPSGLLTGLFDIANVVLNILASGHGDLELAAIGIVMKAERLPNAINIGICQGMLPLVAYNYASGDHKRMSSVISYTLKAGLAVSFAAILIFELFADPVCSVFLNTRAGDDAVAAATTVILAGNFMRIRCLASPVQFLNYSTSFSMQAVGYGKGTIVHAVFRELVFYIPMMFVLNRLFGEYGLVSALVVGEGAGAVFAMLLFRHWKKKNVSV
ncbi:MAG: cation transporter [Lachnospiraceae bacterium]|nr:cation transporter [Lachnospiraceae bacterium]